MAQISHIGHAELEVVDLDASREFFTDLVGLTVTAEVDGKVYLRAWQDFDHHTLVLTQSSRSGLGHFGWRCETREDVLEFEKSLHQLGVDTVWKEGNVGHGDALRFLSPGGLPFELYWEVEAYEAPAELSSALPSHPQLFPTRGAAPRRFDHVTFAVDDVEAEQQWLTSQLGIHHRYFLLGPDGNRWGSWLSRTCLSHELALTRSRHQSGGLLHHVGYYADSPEEVLRAATLLADHGAELEFGPGKHGTSGATFLYFREPSGNRIEIWTGGMLIFSPDWEPIGWDSEKMPLGVDLWGTTPPASWVEDGTSLPGRLTAVPA